MAVTVRIDPIDKDISALVADMTAMGRGAFAAFARESIEEAKKQNQSVLGVVPPYDIFVDGSKGAALESVRPGGVIVAEFKLLDDVIRFIGAELLRASPSITGHYKRSHIVFADGGQIDPAVPQTTLAREYVFVNSVPYARKIERGMSPQAPHGVYEVTAAAARRKFGRIAKIEFGFRTLTGGQRQPAIIVTSR